MLFLTETWQTPNDFLHLNLLTPYQYLSKPRLSGKGGGLAVVYRNYMSLSQLDFHSTTSFEYMVLKVGSKCPLIIILIYRPPKQHNDLFSELSELLTSTWTPSSEVILLGDFNIHVDVTCTNSTQLKSVLDCFDLHQNVTFSTQKYGHILDLICTSGLNKLSINGLVTPISDPKLITFDFASISPLKCINNVEISYSKTNSINVATFADSSAISNVFNFTCPAKVSDLYQSTVADVLDELAPIKTKSVPVSRSCPWFNPALRAMKARGRQL